MKKARKADEKITQKSLKEQNLRRCVHTGKILPISEFKLLKSGRLDCISNEGRLLYQREYREKNQEKKKEYDRRYREKMRSLRDQQNPSDNPNP